MRASLHESEGAKVPERAENVIDLDEARRKRSHKVPQSDAEARAWLDGLMRQHGDRLCRFFAYKVGDQEVARDLVIETFYQAWKSRHTFRGEAKPTTWLWTIGRRAMARHFEKKRRRSAEVLTDELPERASKEEPTLAARRREALLHCLGKLNERIQRTAELVWLLGHTYVEAAEMLEDSADTVRMRLKRARAPLQTCLAERGIVGA